MMLCLHIIADVLDINSLAITINDQPLINIVLIAVLPFLGGLAGFFLLVSAIGNTISMYKYLEQGKSIKSLVTRQVMGGMLLLIFAILSEGLIGYHGAFGNLLHNLPSFDANAFLNIMLTRWNHFETIHTIAWCIILNGIVQGILARNDQWKNPQSLIWKYLILSVIVIIFTQPVWQFVAWVVPGYPWATIPGTGSSISMPQVGLDSWWAVVGAPFLAALAAPMEPLFPYLAVSFWGSIIGIVMCQPVAKMPRNFMRRGIILGFILFVIGTIGIIVNMASVLNVGLDTALRVYKEISFHRHWFPDQPDYGMYLIPLAWLWQFLGLNGFGVMFTLMIIYLVEFRGKGVLFARRTTFVRRFGFIAFTNYNNQWITWLVWAAISYLVVGIPYSQMNWGWTLVTMALVFLVYYGISRLWEKVGYIGSIEWAIGTLSQALIPAKRDPIKAQKWFQQGQLDVQGAFYHPEWLNLVEATEQYHLSLRDSQILAKVAKYCLLIPLFIPFGVFLFPAALKAIKIEGANPHARRALTLTSIALIITAIFLVVCFTMTPNMIGLQIL